jgi:hypothetical protein
MNKEAFIKELLGLWDEYQKFVMLNNKNWTENDFTFSLFIQWLIRNYS